LAKPVVENPPNPAIENPSKPAISNTNDNTLTKKTPKAQNITKPDVLTKPISSIKNVQILEQNPPKQKSVIKSQPIEVSKASGKTQNKSIDKEVLESSRKPAIKMSANVEAIKEEFFSRLKEKDSLENIKEYSYSGSEVSFTNKDSKAQSLVLSQTNSVLDKAMSDKSILGNYITDYFLMKNVLKKLFKRLNYLLNTL
jgi:hypothetical protein